MTEPSTIFVVGLGVGTVFLGLICIVLLCKIMSAINAIGEKKGNSSALANTGSTAPIQKIENRQEIVAAVSAAVAEEMGTNISAIRILSFKKI